MATLFPLSTLTGPAPSYREVMVVYHHAFSLRVAEGSLRPLVFPYHVYGLLLLIVYLCIPHTQRPWLYAARWPLLGFICVWQIHTMRVVTSVSMATGFAAGLIAAWGLTWSFVWLVCYRPQFDAKRVEWRLRESRGGIGGGRENGSVTANGTSGGKLLSRNSSYESSSLRQRPNGQSNGKLVEDRNASTGNSQTVLVDGEGGETEYYWQSYPAKFSERVDWVIDLVSNFRGPGWNWAIPPLPALPPSIKSGLGEPVDVASRRGISSVGLKRFDTRTELLHYRGPQFFFGYFALDILKVIMMKDPYFIFGPNTYALPSHLSQLSPFTLQFYRLAISACAIITSLEMVFILAPLGFSILLGPRALGLRGAAWQYPSTWGSFSKILDKGLNGLWGSWWHQTFRFAFSAPSNYLIANGYVKARSMAAKVLALVFAFGISGFLHSGGSISQLPKTYPWHAPLFFILQAVGIVVQMTVCAMMKPVLRKMPKTIRQAGNLAFTWAWLYSTGGLLVDDFSRGGIWLYEPIPISPLRGLGFGVKGDGWWCWEHIGVSWYTGKHWWESGIAI